MKQTFSLTWVEYEDDDPLGFMWALITLSPVFIMVFYASILVIHRDFHTLFLTLGQLLNEVLNFGLKYLFKQPRPSDTHLEGHGMPSAHAQFMMFFALYMMLFAVYRVREMPRIEKCIIGSGAHFLAILVCYSRYHLRYHTLDQIAVGSTIGAMTGSCWFGIIHLWIAPQYFPVFEKWPLAKRWLFRDYAHIPDPVRFEYQMVQSAAAIQRQEQHLKKGH